MEIRRFVSSMLAQNMYVLVENRHSIIIDPYYDEKSCSLLDDTKLDFMSVTHEHYDHISGANEFRSRMNAPVYANEKCDINMQKPSKNFSKFFEVYLEFQNSVEKVPVCINPKYSCKADKIL